MGIRNLIHRMTAPKVESRASDPALNDAYFTTWGGFGQSAAGVNIDDNTALNYIPLFAAVRNLSESIAYLPLKLYERIDQRAIEKIESQKKPIKEGSREWEILYRKYYNEEIGKLGTIF